MLQTKIPPSLSSMERDGGILAVGSEDRTALFAAGFAHHVLAGVVRRLFGDPDVVDMALAQTGAGHPHKASALMEFVDGVRAEIAHAGADAAQNLMDRVVERAFERHPTLDAFRNEARIGVL